MAAKKRNLFKGLFHDPNQVPVITPEKKKKEKHELASKVVIVYSGKGGVGKTTTTANIAKALADQGKRVMIIDMDVNTPSMPIVFKTPDEYKNIQVQSIGYELGKSIYVEQNLVRRYIKEAVRAATQNKPDYILIDTPPSITDVHINLIKEVKISGLLLVTQPNEMSKNDVFRTATFFSNRGVNIIGVIENMTITEDKGAYDYNLIAQIPFDKTFDFKQVYLNSKPIYEKIAKAIDEVDSVILEVSKKFIMDESITEDALDHFELIRQAQTKELRFINCATWDMVKEAIQDSNTMMFGDRLLDETTTERIKRLVEVFEDDDEAYFLITNAPNTEIPLFPGECGKATLLLNQPHYYGIPRIQYKTNAGNVTLFPHEVMPATKQTLNDLMQDGATLLSDGRYIPDLEILEQIECAFGSRVGLHPDYKQRYKDLLNIE